MSVGVVMRACVCVFCESVCTACFWGLVNLYIHEYFYIFLRNRGRDSERDRDKDRALPRCNIRYICMQYSIHMYVNTYMYIFIYIYVYKYIYM